MPATELNVKVAPAHFGESELGFGTGKEFTKTAVVAVAVQPPTPEVIVTVYVPDAAAVAVAIEGF